ncbi:hypothetical protein KP806_01605 [Paenibacillus sp. N4]|uniref:hypothetical protein n=1 Tax=Paenibacillus vietnamensis TaxID=2590547 RepID=UPI001CD0E1AD|nr:hypothetical protein [Paenibacillus vietnamensis]MCA0753728.1 hypothetical protein [Paenibacillus vietnamensis]
MNYSLRTMLVGLALILVGIYIQNGGPGDLNGTDPFFVTIGLILMVVGFFKKIIKQTFDK